MAVYGPLKDARISVGSMNLSGRANKTSLTADANMLDVTVFGNETGKSKVNLAGLIEWGVSVDGFWDTNAVVTDGSITSVDPALFTNLQGVALPISVCVDSTDGAYGFMGQAVQSNFNMFGGIGEANPFSAEFKCADKLVKGQTFLPDTGNARSGASGTGTVYTLGALTSAQRIYMAVHVLNATAVSSLVFTLKSAVTNFATIASRITSATYTGVGSEFSSLAGPVTDTFWRLDWALTGTSFRALVVVGIQ